MLALTGYEVSFLVYLGRLRFWGDGQKQARYGGVCVAGTLCGDTGFSSHGETAWKRMWRIRVLRVSARGYRINICVEFRGGIEARGPHLKNRKGNATSRSSCCASLQTNFKYPGTAKGRTYGASSETIKTIKYEHQKSTSVRLSFDYQDSSIQEDTSLFGSAVTIWRTRNGSAS